MIETPVKIEKIVRYKVNNFSACRDSSYCLLQVIDLKTDDEEIAERRDDLIQARTSIVSNKLFETACNLWGCNVKITQRGEYGSRTQTGQCRAANYCLKQCFEDRTDKSPEARRIAYEDIMKTCENFADKHSAGSFCPKLDCELSAGFSIDGVAGTAGECLSELRSDQLAFEF